MNTSQLRHLISKIFKILALKEDDNDNLVDYIDSVSIQLEGAKITSKFLNDYDRKYYEVTNTINYLKTHDFTVKQCKREVFKCISILDSIIKSEEDKANGRLD